MADGAALGGAVRFVGRAFEDLVRAVFEKTQLDHRARPGPRLPSVEKMLTAISAHLQRTASEYEPALLDEVGQLLRRLRNTSTHQTTSADFGRIRARLSTELLLATAKYFEILNSRELLKPQSDFGNSVEDVTSVRSVALEGRLGTRYFFGIDGDDTGRHLEDLFQRSAEGHEFAIYSKRISKAINIVSKQAKQPPLSAEIRFCAGDDLLFEGHYDEAALKSLQDLFFEHSGGNTCSIGYGISPKDAYVAMKMAKAYSGKARVIGIELVSRGEVGDQAERRE